MSLIQRFSLLCLLALVLFGILLGWTVSSSMEHSMFQRVVQETAHIVTQNTEKHFTVDALAQPVAEKDLADFDRQIEHLSLGPLVTEVKIWNSDRTVTWSPHRNLVGRQFADNDLLTRALSGKIATKIAEGGYLDAKYREQLNRDRILELYVPIFFSHDNKPAVVVEVYYDLTTLSQAITTHKKILWNRIIVGFTLLYLVLFGIVYGASRKIITQNKKLEEMMFQTITTMINALDAKSAWTRGHSQRTEKYAEMISDELGISGADKKNLMLAGILHDIGKIGTYDSLLDKAEKLTAEEFEIIKKHPDQGVQILAGASHLQETLQIIRHHHERYDGTGYPAGLAGEKIPLLARILQVADCYDAMTADRPYRKALATDMARKELLDNRGSQFDPAIVDAFITALDRKE